VKRRKRRRSIESERGKTKGRTRREARRRGRRSRKSQPPRTVPGKLDTGY
jgi:hypothetical protein